MYTQSIPPPKEEWNFPGEKYGWSFRIKDKKRAIIYRLPRDHFLKVAFVFGQKACDIIFQRGVPEAIKSDLRSAKAYAEGRGIRIDVKSKKQLKDIHFLIDTKLAN